MPSLRELLSRREIVLAAGVYDGLTASLASDAGFAALYVSGASIAYTRLGRPDIGLVTLSEVADTLALIRDRVAAPLIVDADTGYGNALNVQRTVRVRARRRRRDPARGPDFPKALRAPARQGRHSGAGDGGQDQGGRRCASELRKRSSSRAPTRSPSRVSSLPSRARALLSPKRAPMFFSSRLRAARNISKQIVRAFPDRPPLVANMVEGGDTPILSKDRLQALGFSLVIFPGRRRARDRPRRATLLRNAGARRHDRRRSGATCSISTSSTP